MKKVYPTYVNGHFGKWAGKEIILISFISFPLRTQENLIYRLLSNWKKALSLTIHRRCSSSGHETYGLVIRNQLVLFGRDGCIIKVPIILSGVRLDRSFPRQHGPWTRGSGLNLRNMPSICPTSWPPWLLLLLRKSRKKFLSFFASFTFEKGRLHYAFASCSDFSSAFCGYLFRYSTVTTKNKHLACNLYPNQNYTAFLNQLILSLKQLDLIFKNVKKSQIIISTISTLVCTLQICQLHMKLKNYSELINYGNYRSLHRKKRDWLLYLFIYKQQVDDFPCNIWLIWYPLCGVLIIS